MCKSCKRRVFFLSLVIAVLVLSNLIVFIQSCSESYFKEKTRRSIGAQIFNIVTASYILDAHENGLVELDMDLYSKYQGETMQQIETLCEELGYELLVPLGQEGNDQVDIYNCRMYVTSGDEFLQVAPYFGSIKKGDSHEMQKK